MVHNCTVETTYHSAERRCIRISGEFLDEIPGGILTALEIIVQLFQSEAQSLFLDIIQIGSQTEQHCNNMTAISQVAFLTRSARFQSIALAIVCAQLLQLFAVLLDQTQTQALDGLVGGGGACYATVDGVDVGIGRTVAGNGQQQNGNGSE